MQIVKNAKAHNDYNLMGLTEGKILAIWHMFRNGQSFGRKLSPVEYDVWIVLDRWVEKNMPEYYVNATAKVGA